MSIRIIYTPNIKKVSYQIKLLKEMNFIKNNTVEFYEYIKIKDINKNTLKNKVKYNIYIDLISETIYNILQGEYTILIVNDEYLLNNNYMRREGFINAPLKLLDNYVDYYFCLTQYSYNLLLQNINKKKLYLLDGCLTIPTEICNKNTTNKYIYYKVDPHYMHYNVNLLKVWVENYLQSPYKLIICLYYNVEDIIDYLKNIMQIYAVPVEGIIYYNNVILVFNKKYIRKFINNIYASIINISYYNLIIDLYKNIIQNNFIITQKNEISSELLGENALYFDDFTEENIKIILEQLFEIDNKYIQKCILNNNKTLTKKIKSTSTKLNKFFNL